MGECNCFEVMMQKGSENLRCQLPGKEAETFKACWENKVFVLEENSMTSKIGIPISYNYQKFKKSGEPHKNITRGDVKIMMSYCPFCGVPLTKEQDDE